MMNHKEFLEAIHTIAPFRDAAENSPLSSPLFVEFTFWAATAAVAAILFMVRPDFLEKFEIAAQRLARRRLLSVVLVGCMALALRVSLLPLIPIPTPVVHDEFSYIMQGQTFASGRLTNPPHPLWVHFETFHVNMVPTYQSMYPPAQAIFLAVGQVLMGHPWWGVWLSVGLMCACVTWMLQGWMPPEWALLGGVFCVLRFSLFSYWMNSYWGGAVAAIGGALLAGASARLIRRPRTIHALLLALGLLILANSRPYEGFVFALPFVLWLLFHAVRRWLKNDSRLIRGLVPAVGLLILGGTAMLYYNWRGTGNPLLMPYVVNERMYHIAKPFLWQSPDRIPNYHHLFMRTFYCFHELPYALKARSVWGLRELTAEKFGIYYGFFIWPLFLLVVPGVWQMLKRRRVRVLAITLLVMLAGLLVEIWPPHGHYAAPAACIVIAIAMYGMRLLRTWSPDDRPLGLFMVRAMVVVIVAWCAYSTVLTTINPFDFGPDPQARPAQFERARVKAQLERTPGDHVVIVHNRRGYTGGVQWVYNDPDIDHAKIVWAQDMGTEGNEELLRYYPHRLVWIIDPSDGIDRLTAYDGHSAQDTVASAVGPRLVQTSKP